MEPEHIPLPGIGARVVIRHRLAPDAVGTHGEHVSDVLGYLRMVGETQIEVEGRGGVVSIERASITHAKRIPEPPPRRQRRPAPASAPPRDVI